MVVVNLDLQKIRGKSSQQILPKSGLTVIYHGTEKKVTLKKPKEIILID